MTDDRRLHPAEVEAILRGAKHLVGFNRRAMRRARHRLGMGPGQPPPSETQIAFIRAVAYAEICPHDWREQPIAAVEYRGRSTPLFSGSQTRYCPRCDMVNSRMWTVNGYATDWVQPVLPVTREIR